MLETPWLVRLPLLGVALLGGCAAPDPCAAAAATVSACTGEVTAAPPSCDGAARRAATELVDAPCAELVSAGKADAGGLFCREWLRWIGLCKLSSGAGNRAYIEQLQAFGPPPGAYPGSTPDGASCTVQITADLEDAPYYAVEIRSADRAELRFRLSTERWINVRDYVVPDDVAMLTLVIQDSSGDAANRPRLTLEKLDAGQLAVQINLVNRPRRAGDPRDEATCTVRVPAA